MIPRIIHQLWLGKPMPPEIETWVGSLSTVNPGWSHIIWNEAMLHEVGINVAELKAELKSWASVTNYARLQLLLMFGGVYCDADVQAIYPLDRLPLDSEVFIGEQDEGRLCNAVMGAQAKHSWVAWQLEHWGDYDQRDPASGVYLATAAPRDGLTVLPQHVFYPWLYDAAESDQVIHPESILVHRWLKSWGPR